MKRNFENRLDRLEQARGDIMKPGELPETCIIACFDRAKDDHGNELPVVEVGGLFRLAGESEDDLKDRALLAACKGKPVGYKPVLFAHRLAPVHASEKGDFYVDGQKS
ncbi:hypothetical protein [Desulfobacter sp.]|uniref:hypothetical protein n=1 Tax=Desulfobacter sp. TaxID=2294 RepID=UPI003D0A27DC